MLPPVPKLSSIHCPENALLLVAAHVVISVIGVPPWNRHSCVVMHVPWKTLSQLLACLSAWKILIPNMVASTTSTISPSAIRTTTLMAISPLLITVLRRHPYKKGSVTWPCFGRRIFLYVGRAYDLLHGRLSMALASLRSQSFSS